METKKYFYQNANRLKEIRQFLRNNPTLAEEKLWQHLKGKAVGYKFRRQYSIKNRIADFCCEKLKLVIEIDGWTHESDLTRDKDKLKEEMFEKGGYQVIRFANEQIYGDIGVIVAEIGRVCKERALRLGVAPIPHPSPLP